MVVGKGLRVDVDFPADAAVIGASGRSTLKLRIKCGNGLFHQKDLQWLEYTGEQRLTQSVSVFLCLNLKSSHSKEPFAGGKLGFSIAFYKVLTQG